MILAIVYTEVHDMTGLELEEQLPPSSLFEATKET